MSFEQDAIVERMIQSISGCFEGVLPSKCYWHNYATYKGRVKKTFGRKLPKLNSGWILDVGCSDGTTTAEIANLYSNCRVIGIYKNPKLIEEARKTKPWLNFMVQDAYNPDGIYQRFDAVFCMNNVLFVLPQLMREGKLEEVISGIVDLAKPRGHVLFSGGEKTFTGRRGEYPFVQEIMVDGWMQIAKDMNLSSTNFDFPAFLDMIQTLRASRVKAN